jgi:hypothetical protein
MTVAEEAHPDPENAPNHEKPQDVTIVVNNADVTLPKGKYTGLQIKEAAIEQGVKDIALNFVLSVQHGNHYQVVGDHDVIEIRKALDFVAVTGDDNS